MTSVFARVATRAAYAARQLPRMAWYLGHGVAMRRLSQAARSLDGQSTRPPAHTDKPVPGRDRLFADMAQLLERDLANIEAGVYPRPADHDGSLPMLLNLFLLGITVRIFQSRKWFHIDGLFAMLWLATFLTIAHGALWLLGHFAKLA